MGMKEKSGAARLILATIMMMVGWVVPVSATAVNTQSTPVSYRQALADAERVASLHPDWIVMRTAGDSMAPHYNDNAILLVAKADFNSLRPGMIAVYRDAEGDLVGHPLVTLNENGWVAKGPNNGISDPTLVTPENFLGVVFGVFHSAGADARIGNHLPMVVSKRY